MIEIHESLGCKCGGLILEEKDVPIVVDQPSPFKPEDYIMTRCNLCKRPHVFSKVMWAEMIKVVG